MTELTLPLVDVVICTHDDRRWSQLHAAVLSVLGQPRLERVFVVVDGDEGLLGRAQDEFPHGVKVLWTGGGRGLSAARNAGIAAGASPYVAFLDDDAVADPGWLVELAVALDADQRVGATGGVAVPVWPNRRPPGGFQGRSTGWSAAPIPAIPMSLGPFATSSAATWRSVAPPSKPQGRSIRDSGAMVTTRPGERRPRSACAYGPRVGRCSTTRQRSCITTCPTTVVRRATCFDGPTRRDAVRRCWVGSCPPARWIPT